MGGGLPSLGLQAPPVPLATLVPNGSYLWVDEQCCVVQIPHDKLLVVGALLVEMDEKDLGGDVAMSQIGHAR